MQITPFKLERYFAQYEFKVKYLLSPSDCESLSMSELLRLADPDSLALWNELRLGYTESPGHPTLRAEVSRLYQTISPDDVVIAAPEEAIFVAMHTLLRPGDHVVCILPAYQSLYEIARAIGCDVTPWTLELGAEGWQLNLDQLECALTERTRLIVLNFPHNPTGCLPSRDELDAIVDLARKRGLSAKPVRSEEARKIKREDNTKRHRANKNGMNPGPGEAGFPKPSCTDSAPRKMLKKSQISASR